MIYKVIKSPNISSDARRDIIDNTEVRFTSEESEIFALDDILDDGGFKKLYPSDHTQLQTYRNSGIDYIEIDAWDK